MTTVVPMRRPSPPRHSRPGRAAPEPLWREAVGAQLRSERTRRGERLVDVGERAGVSAQYLSEVERGKKDPSSEVLAAVAGALDVTVVDLTTRAATRMRSATTARVGLSERRVPVCLAA